MTFLKNIKKYISRWDIQRILWQIQKYKSSALFGSILTRESRCLCPRVLHFCALFWPDKFVFLWTFLWIEILSKNEIEIFLTFLKCKLSLMRVKKRFKTCSQMRFLEHLKISWVGILLKIKNDIFSHFFDVFYFQQSAKWRIKMSWNWWKKHVISTFFSIPLR